MIWQAWWVFAFFGVLIAAAVIHFIRRKKRDGAIPLSTVAMATKVSPSIRVRLKYTPEICKYLGIALVILALARPQTTDEKVNRNVEGIDIMLSIDISHSMLIEDMKPDNRLEAVKVIITDFVNKRTSDRIGLVVFSGESYTRVPLTLDYALLKQSIKDLEPSTNVKMGTAIGVGLANAVSRLNESKARTRVVILLTDGENNTGLIDPETALKIAKGYNIRIYTVGVGRDGQAQLPVYSTDLFGRRVKRYQPIHSAINENLLKQLAAETGGRFYRANDSKTLGNVFSDIDRLEKTKIEESRFTRYNERYMDYLKWGLLLYLLGMLCQFTVFKRGL